MNYKVNYREIEETLEYAWDFVKADVLKDFDPHLIAASASAAALGSNTGNGAMGSITVTDGAKSGVYTLTIIEPGSNVGTFVVTDPDGIEIGHGAVASAFSAGGLAFTLADGGTDFIAGDQLQITVTGGVVQTTSGAVNGIFRISGAATTDNSGAWYQSKAAFVNLVAAKPTATKCRLNASSINAEWAFGFQVVDANPFSGWGTDYIVVHCAEDSGIVTLRVGRDSSEVAVALGTLHMVSTNEIWELVVEPDYSVPQQAVIRVKKDGQQVYQATFTNVPDDVDMNLSFGNISGSATGTQYLDWDFLAYRGARQ